MPQVPSRPRSTPLSVLLLWLAFYASFTLFAPPLLDDADSVHSEVAREMLLRHDYVTLYANGIRYLEKAPLLYWSMAASMKLFGTSAAAARLPLAFAVLALALVIEAFTRRLFRSTRAGLYAALILLSSFGLFIFTRITIPDVGVCLWISLALYCFWRTEELNSPPQSDSDQTRDTSSEIREADLTTRDSKLETEGVKTHLRLYCGGFAAACALNVLTKGLIGIVFPVGIVLAYRLLTRGLRGTWRRLGELYPWTSLGVFLLLAAPWHILAGLANPTQGHPTPFHFVQGHWIVPLPTDGNVRGWFWFYFMNEHVLRYLNLRVPHDYDTAPLWLFWGLCFVWMMPWSAFVFKAVGGALPWRNRQWRTQLSQHALGLKDRGLLLCVVWAAFVLLFFSLSTRQEYYVLPALPAIAILIAGWLAYQAPTKPEAQRHRRAARRCIGVLLLLGAVFASASVYFLLHTKAPAPNTDLAQLLQQNPGDYALSMGHFLDLNAQALGLFRVPLALAALSLLGGPLWAFLLRSPLRRYGVKAHFANLALAAGAFGFLLAAHLGLQIFAPVIGSAELARAIAPQVQPQDIIAIHGEYESGSTLGFYLHRNDIHILEGRSSNLWYGSFFPDAPPIFETPRSIAQKWTGSQRIFLWQSLTDEPRNLPALPGPVYILVKNGGKEIVSNQPNR
ncbi:phospholipid carrier-dependent glycosyltransferase [Granulicella mallensis]|uniref:Glycosyl transferase family 39 n=1 Tax=Granulicella mallensis (strain ATCC BAA-1857 / DSM 23137 / MP5ACTX8) TaxID=682795 RepID=G8NYW2_GRAMM|nr:glycosyl transferase family 39 [Granulicella mallensis MP5ACTX8]